MVESNKQLVRQLFTDWSNHDINRTCAHISDECNGGGSEGFRRELEGFIAAFPDITITLDDILAEDDKVASRVTMRATHLGDLGGIPPTGREVEMKANHIFRCENGKIVQRHGQMDRLEVMMQLGMKLVSNES